MVLAWPDTPLIILSRTEGGRAGKGGLEGEGESVAQGAVTVWQGDVSWTTSLWRSPPPPSPPHLPHLPPYHAISPAAATTLFLSVTFVSLSQAMFSSSLFRHCVCPPVCISGAWLSLTLLSVSPHVSYGDEGILNFEMSVCYNWYVGTVYTHCILTILHI